MKIAFVDFSGVPPYNCDTPYTKGLGGTQSSMCYYAEELANRGHETSIFLANTTSSEQVRGVWVRPTSQLLNESYDVVTFIMSIHKPHIPLLSQLRTKLKIFWIPHNTNEPAMNEFEPMIYHVDYIGFMSEIQRKKYVDLYNIPSQKTFLILNGINPGLIGDFDITNKKPRFIYTPQPDRGLLHLLEIWPKIVFRWPEAELHTYSSRKNYGFTPGADEDVLLKTLGSMKNCFVHDPIGQIELAKVLRESAFFIYPANFYETGCITVTEAAGAGCIPIVTDLGVLGQYYTNAVRYTDAFKEKLVELADNYMTMFTDNKTEFYSLSERLAVATQKERNYDFLVSEFLNNVNALGTMKVNAIETYEEAKKHIGKQQYHEARLRLENMIPVFQTHNQAYEYYLNMGMACFYTKATYNAINYWNLAHKIKEDYTLCVNMLLAYEEIKDEKSIIYWAERSLKYKFEPQIVFKVLNMTSKLSYFERCKWGKYLLSLYNNDIQNAQWLSFFLTYGNMISSDFSLVLRHEDGQALVTQLITNALASMKLNNQSIDVSSQPRGNVEKLFSNLFLGMNYFVTKNPEYYHYVKYFMEQLPKKRDVVTIDFAPIKKDRKLRIGFFTGDLKNHPVGYILNGFLKYMNPSEFEIFVFATNEIDEANFGAIIERVKASAELIRCAKFDEKKLVNTIREKDIDLLVEMTGHTGTGSDLLAVLRYKPARVIANWFAFPNTYGIPECDFKIGDSTVFPNGLEAYYVEKFCKLKGGMHTYNPIAELEVLHKKHDGIVFGCTNNPKKYRPEWIKTVGEIMKAVPNSKLKMRYFGLDDPSIQEFYFKEFEKHGIAKVRVDLGLGENFLRYFDSYADMDIMLDPFPYNGGTINIETLYASLPYITLLGNSYVSRVGGSILNQIGHPELIAKTKDDYVKLAVELAQDPARIENYKKTLRQDFKRCSLGDQAAFAESFMDGVKWMLKEKGWITELTPSIAHTPAEVKKEDTKQVPDSNITVSSTTSLMELLVSTNPAPTHEEVSGPTLVLEA